MQQLAFGCFYEGSHVRGIDVSCGLEESKEYHNEC